MHRVRSLSLFRHLANRRTFVKDRHRARFDPIALHSTKEGLLQPISGHGLLRMTRSSSENDSNEENKKTRQRKPPTSRKTTVLPRGKKLLRFLQIRADYRLS